VNAGAKELPLYDFRKYLYAFLWFCGVKLEDPVDWDEPEKVGRSIKIMNIKHAVITSVEMI
jgi:hypothetical protein